MTDQKPAPEGSDQALNENVPDAQADTQTPPSIILLRLIGGVALIVLIVHWPALSSKAISFDDDHYLLNNSLVQNPGWDSTRRFLTEVREPSTVPGYYQPLTMISLMVDYAIGGRTDNLAPFRRTSLALHIANTVLVIVFLYLLFGQPWPAAMVGLLFGAHPLTVEPTIRPLIKSKFQLQIVDNLVNVAAILFRRHQTKPGPGADLDEL